LSDEAICFCLYYVNELRYSGNGKLPFIRA
jgi:hypothetical protein